MLNQLIESKNHKDENSRRGGFVLTTLFVFTAVLFSGWTYSLFGKTLGLGSGDYEFSSLVAPVPLAETAPPPKEEIKVQRTTQRPSNEIILKDLYQSLASTTTPPKELTGQKDVVNASQFDLNKVRQGNQNLIPEDSGRGTGSTDQTCGLCEPSDTNPKEKIDKDPEPIVVKSPAKTPEPVKTQRGPVSLGVINGKASYLATPPYPASARQIRASGAVTVQVLIDEQGTVVSATAADGHPLLRNAAVQAAKQSRFTPTKLSNVPVKVTGVIIYNFKP